MRTSRKRKANPQYGASFSAASPASHSQQPHRMVMRPDDSLYVAAVIGSASVFSWIVAVL